MFGIKKLDRYVFSNFISVFAATFFVSLFILLMQFLWRYMDDVVGKGFDTAVMLEFFFYAALSLVPMALPLAILLGSLMTFGNLGERLELLSMKAAGISLYRIMMPLICTALALSLSSFLFANNIIPYTQVKLWTLLYSMREKSPEVDVPTNVFYTGVKGYNIYVKGKDTDRRLLEKMMIYDFSEGFENAVVTVADSGQLQFTEDKRYIVLTLYNGESFENLRRQIAGNSARNTPYRREVFGQKQISIAFNANFEKMDESLMKGQYVTENVTELGIAMDSLAARSDSLVREINRTLDRSLAVGTDLLSAPDSLPVAERSRNLDSLFLYLPKEDMLATVVSAQVHSDQAKQEIQYNYWSYDESQYLYRRRGIEWHRKFTLAFACLVFFFIGAPLGAIIRKGGLGMPVVVSIFLFIFYYVIDNTGYKFARDGAWTPGEGMWLSTAVLLPLGAFLTYKAVNDSVVLDVTGYFETWRNRLKRKSKIKMKQEKQPFSLRRLASRLLNVFACVALVLGLAFVVLPMGTLAFLPLVAAVVFALGALALAKKEKRRLPICILVSALALALVVGGKTLLGKDEVAPKTQEELQQEQQAEQENLQELEQLENLE